jgi:hypothetical protein
MYGCKDANNCSSSDYVQARTDVEKNLKLLPLGYRDFDFAEYWANAPEKFPRPLLCEWAFNLCGWLLTAIAVSLGAPFWFDLINKFINIRMVGQKPLTAEDLKSTTLTKSGEKP